ncbi:hypothetical protein GDO81_000633 [Engystomops pustulosus]|uniref:Uncharacterized protein n=1 Tax=Engystomops pustulosus TaxID=76066 RepID=A0AAV7D5S2_ENGPU|nr:hypothetical protein GDO81_000633 [Engystomops pustulosus]
MAKFHQKQSIDVRPSPRKLHTFQLNNTGDTPRLQVFFTQVRAPTLKMRNYIFSSEWGEYTFLTLQKMQTPKSCPSNSCGHSLMWSEKERKGQEIPSSRLNTYPISLNVGLQK